MKKFIRRVLLSRFFWTVELECNIWQFHNWIYGNKVSFHWYPTDKEWESYIESIR